MLEQSRENLPRGERLTMCLQEVLEVDRAKHLAVLQQDLGPYSGAIEASGRFPALMHILNVALL